MSDPRTIQEAYQQAMEAGDSGGAIYVGLVAKAAKRAADAAWDETSTLRVAGQWEQAAYQSGKANALCELLGDQAALSRLGAFD